MNISGPSATNAEHGPLPSKSRSGGTYFFTVALKDRRADTLVAHIGGLGSAFRKAQSEYAFTTNGIVVLSDHLHSIMTLPEGDANFCLRWQRIKTLFTHALRDKGVRLATRDVNGRALWQRRFWEHTIRDDVDYARHVAYIHYNPVKHGYVTNAVDWPYSSLHRFIRRGVLPADWVGGVVEAGMSGLGEQEDESIKG